MLVLLQTGSASRNDVFGQCTIFRVMLTAVPPRFLMPRKLEVSVLGGVDISISGKATLCIIFNHDLITTQITVNS